MKFRDPKTGEAFDSLDPKFIPIYGSYEIEPAEAARLMGYEIIEDEKEANMEKKDKPLGEWSLKEVQSYCLGRSTMCDGCQFMGIHCSGDPTGWTLDDQSCAKDTNVADKPAKPRLAEVLGVEVEEIFKIEGESNTYFIDKDGNMIMSDCGFKSSSGLFKAINHPESIIRAPLLTEAELERCRVYWAKWVYRPTGGRKPIFLCKVKPVLDANGFPDDDESVEDIIASVWDETMFPSVHPGDLIEVP